MLFRNRHHGKSASRSAYFDSFELMSSFNVSECNWYFEFFHKRHIYTSPNWCPIFSFWVKMHIFLVKLSHVGVRFACHLGHSVHTARRVRSANGVIKEYQVPHFHIIAHEITRLIIANSRPSGFFIPFEIVNRVAQAFRFYESIIHNYFLRKVNNIKFYRLQV